MSGRGGRGRGRGRRGRGGRGGRGGPPPAKPGETVEKSVPTFIKIAKLRPHHSSFLVVKVKDVNENGVFQPWRQSRGQRPISCTEALVGDETGCILLSTRQAELIEVLKENDNKYVCLMNVTMYSGGGKARLEASQFSTIKPVENCKDILPEDTDTSFEINESNDRSTRKQPKPQWAAVSSLEPEGKCLNLIVKVETVEITERARMDGTLSKVAEAYVGDADAGVKLVARGEHVPLVEAGKVIALFNAHITMFSNTYMRLVVDRWSSVKPVSEVEAGLLPESGVPTGETAVPDVGHPKQNRSLIEWVQQQ
eukprot:NODE_181_length_1258_cov_479.441202_g177_i0.p1 GENE.NODE_181_length_1258_cov_479.441202_g177_i0~~NODE_181_length_1258_cov_479.441202_g177_i0.p1  ORF type:complete len:310 (-),score=56.03 NODE_181_length_1258_cov_479.441202_g177_i0:235-1164(-)